MNGEGYDSFNNMYHSGLEEGPEKIRLAGTIKVRSPQVERFFVQIAMCYDPNSDTVFRNALDNEGRVWIFGEDDWHPLPRCPQGEVKI